MKKEVKKFKILCDEYLKKGDITNIANELIVHRNSVHRVIAGKTENVVIWQAVYDKAHANMIVKENQKELLTKFK